MKRAIIWMGAIGLCLLLVGTGLSALGLRLGGTVRGLTYDRDDGFTVEYSGEEHDHADYAASSTNADTAQYDGQTVTALNLDLGGADCRIETGTAFSVVCDDERVQTTVADGVLSVTARSGIRWQHHSQKTVCITVPAGFCFDDVTISYGAGDLDVYGLETTSLSVTGGAGEAELKDVVAEICDLSIGVGELELTGDIRQEARLECGVGELNVTLTGGEDDWDYDLRCGLGELRFGDTVTMDFSGNAQRQDGRSKTLTAQCGVGELHIDFD